MLLLLLLMRGYGEGSLLNPTGALDISYTWQRSNEAGNALTMNSLQQRYNLGSFGDLVDGHVGTYTASFTYMNQSGKTGGVEGDRNYELEDYSIAANLFPGISPVSLYAQQVVNSNSDGVVAKNRLTTYGVNWSLSLPSLPRFAVSLNQSNLKSNDPLLLPDTLTDLVNVDTATQIGDTSLQARYQFFKTEVIDGTGNSDTSRSNAVNLNTQSQFTPHVAFSTFSRYTSLGGSTNPAFGFFPDRGFGASLFWNPGTFWDTNLRWEYSEVPDSILFRTQLAMANFNLHPNQQTDVLTSLRYYTFTNGAVTTDAPFADLNVSWRPFFGLTTGAGVSAGYTVVSGGAVAPPVAASVVPVTTPPGTPAPGTTLLPTPAPGTPETIRSTFENFRIFANYSKSLTLIRYTAGYSGSYGINAVDQEVANVPHNRDYDLMNTLNLTAENTQIRYVHLAAAVTFNDIDRSVNTLQPNPNQTSIVYQINADSNYYKNLLFTGDSLQLLGSTNLTHISGFGIAGYTFLIDSRAAYYYRGLIGTFGYTHQDYPSGYYSNSDRIYEELQWSGNWLFLTAMVDLQDSHQWGQGDMLVARDYRQGTASLSSQLGKLLLALTYQISNDSVAGVRFVNQSLFARMSRFF